MTKPSGPRFFDVSRAYDPDHQQGFARPSPSAQGLDLADRVFMPGIAGRISKPRRRSAPCAFLGADSVGMSTVP